MFSPWRALPLTCLGRINWFPTLPLWGVPHRFSFIKYSLKASELSVVSSSKKVLIPWNCSSDIGPSSSVEKELRK